jgi:hypothetical protein
VIPSGTSISVFLSNPLEAGGAAARETDLFATPAFLRFALFGGHAVYFQLFGGHGFVAFGSEEGFLTAGAGFLTCC